MYTLASNGLAPKGRIGNVRGNAWLESTRSIWRLDRQICASDGVLDERPLVQEHTKPLESPQRVYVGTTTVVELNGPFIAIDHVCP